MCHAALPKARKLPSSSESIIQEARYRRHDIDIRDTSGDREERHEIGQTGAIRITAHTKEGAETPSSETILIVLSAQLCR